MFVTNVSISTADGTAYVSDTQLCAESHYRWLGDKTSYLKNVKCSGELKNMAAITCKFMKAANFHLSFVASFLQMGTYGLGIT